MNGEDGGDLEGVWAKRLAALAPQKKHVILNMWPVKICNLLRNLHYLHSPEIGKVIYIIIYIAGVLYTTLSYQISKKQNVLIASESTVLASVKDTAGSPEATLTANTVIVESQAPTRRFSLRSLNFTRKNQEVRNKTLPAAQEQEIREDSSIP